MAAGGIVFRSSIHFRWKYMPKSVRFRWDYSFTRRCI